MYIRRKVFSLLQDENGEERYFSTTEFTDERLYAEKEDNKGKKAAIAAGATVAGTGLAAGGYQGARHIGKKRAERKLNEAIEGGELENIRKASEKMPSENKVDKFGKNVESKVKRAGQWVKGKWTGEGNKRVKAVIDEETGKITDSAYKYLDTKTGKALTQEEATKLGKKIGNRNKAIMIATPVVAGSAIAAKKIAKNRKKSED